MNKLQLLEQLSKNWGFDSVNQFLESFKVEFDDIGDSLSTKGYENYVFEYKEANVVKFLRPRVLTKLLCHLDRGKDLNLLKSILDNDLLAKGEVRHSAIDKRIECTIQEKFDNYHYLCKSDLKNDEIISQYVEIKDLFFALYNDYGLALDLVGYEGMLGHITNQFKNIFRSPRNRVKSNLCLSNILVTNENKLKLIDYRLVPTRFSGVKNLRDLFIVLHAKFEHFWQKLFLKILT